MYEMSSSRSARKGVGKERQASEGSSQANVCLGEPQPEPAGRGRGALSASYASERVLL